MPPPSMLSTVMSFPWDGGGQVIVASALLLMICSHPAGQRAAPIGGL
jgi:hypothetical protein